MIPKLFSANETQFQGFGLGGLGVATKCRVTRQLNGAYELEMVYPIIGRRFRDLKPRNIILASVGPGEEPQPFRIYRTKFSLALNKTVYARHIAYDLMGCTMRPFPAGSLDSVLATIQYTANNEGFPFVLDTNLSSAAQCGITVPRSVWAMLGGQRGSLLDVYGGEWIFDGFRLSLVERIGTESGIMVRWGKNLQDLQQEDNLANTWTAVVPYWQSADGLTVVTLPEGGISTGTFGYTRELVWDASAEFEEAPTVEALRSRTRQYISSNRVGEPDVGLDVKWVPLDQTEEYKHRRFPSAVHLGDTVTVEYPSAADPKTGKPTDFVRAAARVVETVWLPLVDRYEYVRIGAKRSNFVSVVAQVQKEMAWVLSKVRR